MWLAGYKGREINVFHCSYSLSDSPSSVCSRKHLFDFENVDETSCFQSIPTGTVTLSSEKNTVKKGQKSLKWKATGASRLRLTFALALNIPTDWLRHGGVKVWFYKEEASPGKTLRVDFKHTFLASTNVAQFQVNLDFQGWRGIWVKFSECKLTSSSLSSAVINDVNFVLSEADTIYMDLLEFKSRLGKQSRDKIVPPISPFGLELYDASNTWQRTYHWSQQPIPASPSTIDQRKKKSLEVIKSRLKNWYCDETKTTANFSPGSFLQKRWDSLLNSVNDAHSKYDALDFEGGKVVGPPLFCRNCRNGKKFGVIMEKILLPLALEYYLRSRTNEIADTVTAQLDNLNSDDQSTKNDAYEVIAGKNVNMQNTFKGTYPLLQPRLPPPM